jgi:predicted ArsR family transcriptional regulator
MSSDTQYDARDESGQYTSKYAEDDILAAVREHTPAATSEVAEAVGFARQNADYRLRRLADEGKVQRKKVGPTLVWLPAADGDES